MAIIRNDTDKTFTLVTKNTMYQMKVDEIGVLVHTYYGAKMDYTDMYYATQVLDGAAFSPTPPELENNWTYSHNATFQELSFAGLGDFRLTTIGLRNSDGS